MCFVAPESLLQLLPSLSSLATIRIYSGCHRILEPPHHGFNSPARGLSTNAMDPGPVSFIGQQTHVLLARTQVLVYGAGSVWHEGINGNDDHSKLMYWCFLGTCNCDLTRCVLYSTLSYSWGFSYQMRCSGHQYVPRRYNVSVSVLSDWLLTLFCPDNWINGTWGKGQPQLLRYAGGMTYTCNVSYHDLHHFWPEK